MYLHVVRLLPRAQESRQKIIYVMATTFSILATTSRIFMTLRSDELWQFSSRLTGEMVNLVQFWQPHPLPQYNFAGLHHLLSLLYVANIHLQLVWLKLTSKAYYPFTFNNYTQQNIDLSSGTGRLLSKIVSFQRLSSIVLIAYFIREAFIYVLAEFVR